MSDSQQEILKPPNMKLVRVIVACAWVWAGLGSLSQTAGVSQVKPLFTLLDLCVSSLRRGHANLLCIVPILTDDPRRESSYDGYSACV